MRRFFLDLPAGAPPRPGQRADLDAEESKHLRTVLRLDDGDTVALTDGRGHAMTAVIVGGGRRGVTVELAEVLEETAETAPPLLHLACAVVKGRRFEYALEKAMELGAHVITPLETKRGVVEPRAGKKDRWQNLLVGALKQCGRCHRPDLRTPASLAEVLDAARGQVVYGAAPGDAVAVAPIASSQLALGACAAREDGASPPPELLALVGPEGGWTEGELQLLDAAGARPLDLGPHVLRTETAAAAVLVVLQQARRAWLDLPAAPA